MSAAGYTYPRAARGRGHAGRISATIHWHRARARSVQCAGGLSHAGLLLVLAGKRMMKLELPDVPLAPIKVVDLNGDGLNDLLVVVQVGDENSNNHA
eukprot:4978232-Pyramimonas_sp.AAC.1